MGLRWAVRASAREHDVDKIAFDGATIGQQNAADEGRSDGTRR